MSTVGFHVTEDCAEAYLQNESGMEFLQLAKRLHDYLQQGQHLPVRSLFEATDGCKEISREAFDTQAKRRMERHCRMGRHCRTCGESTATTSRIRRVKRDGRARRAMRACRAAWWM